MGSSDIRFSLRFSGGHELQHGGQLFEDAVFCKVLSLSTFTVLASEHLHFA